MIILDHVSKHYQTRDKKDFVAIEPTSLEIKQGEIFGLMATPVQANPPCCV